MRSALALHEAVVDDPQDRDGISCDLLVLWRHPETGQIMPVGRLRYRDGIYTFAYVRAVLSIDRFRPLPGLPDLSRSYSSPHLPIVFQRRVMATDRPDYENYLRILGLDRMSATPWEQIVRSGGVRAGDTLHVMEMPTVESGRARARFFASGVRHIPELARIIGGRSVHVSAAEQESALNTLDPGSRVQIVPEVGNPADEHAALVTTAGIPLGWVPRVLSLPVRRLLAAGPLDASVVRNAGPASPPRLRLVVEIDTPAPPGFAFDPRGQWELLAL